MTENNKPQFILPPSLDAAQTLFSFPVGEYEVIQTSPTTYTLKLKETNVPDTDDTNPSLAEKLVTDMTGDLAKIAHILATDPDPYPIEDSTTKEDTMSNEYTLPIITNQEEDTPMTTAFEVYFRLDDTQDWEFEDDFATKIQAMQYCTNTQVQAGEFKIVSAYHADMLIDMNFERHDKVYMYARELDEAGKNAIIITNALNPRDAKSIDIYNQAFNDNRLGIVRKLQFDENVTPCIPMTQSNTYLRPLLTNRVAKIGGKYRVEVYSHVAMLNQAYLIGRIEAATFAFVEEDNLTVFFVLDADGKKVGWDDFADYLGMEFRNSKKFGKRAKEFVRLSLFWTVRNGSRKVNIHTIEVDPALEKAVDGNGGISMSFALEMAENIPDPKVRASRIRAIKARELVLVNFRLTNGMGLFKGNRIIIPDEQLLETYGYVPDMVEYTIDNKIVNLKGEIRTDGTWEIATFEPHHAHTPPRTNDQLLACLSKNGTWLFTEDELKEDQTSLHNELYTDLASGKFPSYLRADFLTSAIGSFKMDPNRLAKTFKVMGLEYDAKRFRYSDAPLLESGFMIARTGQGFTLQQEKAIYKEKKIVVPIRHAAYMHVTTMSIVKACGYNPEAEGYDTSKSFFYPPVHNWVEPDQVFIDTYALHGGKDGDDAQMVMVRKTYDRNKGETPESPVVRAIVVRMPMAWGEYSIQEIDTKDFPFYHTWNEMPTVDITEGVRPEFLHEMEQEIMGMPTGDVETPETYNMDWSKYQLKLAVMNPGVGRIINALLGYFATACTYPPVQLASTEDFVDTLQQTPDEVAFFAIDDEINRLINETCRLGLPVDQHIWNTRMKGTDKPKDLVLTKDSFYQRMMDFNHSMLVAWEKKIEHLSTHGRLVIPEAMEKQLPETIVILRNGEEHTVNTMEFVKKTFNKFKNESRKQGGYPDQSETNPGDAKREFWGMLNRRMVTVLIGQPARHIIMTGLYQYIITNNLKDNILFQTPWGTDESTMHLWLDALYHLGVADKFIERDGEIVVVHPEDIKFRKSVVSDEETEGANGVF